MFSYRRLGSRNTIRRSQRAANQTQGRANHSSIDIIDGIGRPGELVQGGGIFLANFTPANRHGVAHARRLGSRSPRGGSGAGGVPGAGPQKPSPQVSDRAVETESVFGAARPRNCRWPRPFSCRSGRP